MKYTVIWVPSAVNEFSDLWNQAPNRKELTEAANRIDRALQVDAERKGIEFEEDRALFDPPLVVTFTVSLEDRQVRVLQVQRVTI